MVSRRSPNWYFIVELYMVSQSESKMNWKWSSEGHHINPEDMGVPLWTGSWCSDGGYAVPQYTQSGSVHADTALTLLPCCMLHVYIIQLISFLPLPACLKKVQQRDLSWEKCIESAGEVVVNDSLNSLNGVKKVTQDYTEHFWIHRHCSKHGSKNSEQT